MQPSINPKKMCLVEHLLSVAYQSALAFIAMAIAERMHMIKANTSSAPL